MLNKNLKKCIYATVIFTYNLCNAQAETDQANLMSQQLNQTQIINESLASNRATFPSSINSTQDSITTPIPQTTDAPKISQNQTQAKEVAVGVLPIPLNLNKMSPMELWFSTIHLHEYLKDPNIEAILLIFVTNIHTQRGQASLFFNELQRAKKQKPIIALIIDSCTDSCFYSAAGASYIIASPVSTIGNIGVYLPIERHSNVRQNGAQTGDVKTKIFYKGKYKLMTDPLAEDLTDDQQKHIDSFLQDAYDQICEDIATARHLDVKKASEWADGKVFNGKKAVTVGLLDKTGSFSDAQDTIKSILAQKKQTSDFTIRLLTYYFDTKGLSLMPFEFNVEMTYNSGN